MTRSFVVGGLILAVGAGWIFFAGRGDIASVVRLPVVDSLGAMKADGKKLRAAIKSDTVENAPVPSKTGPWPKAVAEDTRFLFGQMQVREARTHEFTIRNEGEADLLLTAGKPTCKCTQFGFGTGEDVTEKQAVVKPRESVILTMAWHAGAAPDRSFRHGGDVHTNDPQRMVIGFSVEGAIEMPFELMPSAWDVGSVFDQQPGKLKATLGTKIFKTLEITSIESPSGKVTVTPSPLSSDIAAGFMAGYDLDVEVSDDIPAGNFDEVVLIRVAQQPEPIPIFVHARKQGVIRLQQMAGTLFDMEKLILQLGSFPASEGREAKLLLIVDEKDMAEPFRFTEIKVDPSFVTTKLDPVGAPTGSVHRYLLTIAVPPGRPHAQRTARKPGSVKLSTNHPSGESLEFGLLLYSN